MGPTLILRGNNSQGQMSALGQKRTLRSVSPMSALCQKQTLRAAAIVLAAIARIGEFSPAVDAD